MARWTGTWLTGLDSAGVHLRDPAEARGVRLGLPADGSGSIASGNARVGAFLVDTVLSALAAGLLQAFVASPSPVQRNVAASAVFAVVTVIGLALTGQTPGMRLLGLRVRDLRSSSPSLGLLPAALRTVLLMTFVLAVISDRDGRGLHDRAARTAVVRV